MHFHKFILWLTWFFVHWGSCLFPCWPNQSHSAPYEVMFSVFLPLAAKEWKKPFFLIWANTTSLTQLKLLKNPEDGHSHRWCLYKVDLGQELHPRKWLLPLFKTSLRFQVTGDHLAGRGGRSLSNTASQHDCLSSTDWVMVSRACRMDFPVMPLAQKIIQGGLQKLQGSHWPLEIRVDTELAFPWCGFQFWQDRLWVMTGNLLFCVVNTSESHPGQVVAYLFRQFKTQTLLQTLYHLPVAKITSLSHSIIYVNTHTSFTKWLHAIECLP